MVMLVIAAILTAAMVMQYRGGEIPCPLCLLQRVAKDEEGTALIEYSILLGVIAVVCVAAAVAVGNWSGSKWQALCTALSITC